MNRSKITRGNAVAAPPPAHGPSAGKGGDDAIPLMPLAVGLILAFTAIPVGLRQPSIADIRFGLYPADFALNLALYLPLGLTLVKQPLWRTVLTGFLLSLLIEISQFASASRFPGLMDVAANTLGCAMGAIAGRGILSRGGDPTRIALNKRVAAASAATILAICVAPLLHFSPKTDFSNWNSQYEITVGDEPSLDRPWSGDILRTAILPHAMAAEGVSRLQFQGADARIPDAILDHGELLADQLPAVRGNALLDRQAARTAFQTLTDKGALTILIWFKTHDIEQGGPARLVTYSLNPYAANVMLGQEGRALVFRVRTPASGPIGLYPHIRTGPVIASNRQVFAAATYDGATSRVYVDGQPAGRAELSVERPLIPIERLHLAGIGWMLGVLAATLCAWLVVMGMAGGEPGVLRRRLWLAPVAAFIAAEVFWLARHGGIPSVLNLTIAAGILGGLLSTVLVRRRFRGELAQRTRGENDPLSILPESMGLVLVAARKLYGSFQQRGVTTTARYTAMSMLEQIESRRFDRRYGVETRSECAAPDDRRGYFYRGSPIRLTSRSLASLPIDHREFVFVDLGCGKGRVLLLAADYPYKRIIGVELSRELQQIALSNSAAFRAYRPTSTDIICVSRDAAQFVLPDEPLVIYMFNSFPESVLVEVLANLKASLLASPRPVFLLYSNPYLHPVLDRCGFLRRQQVVHVPFVGPQISRYRVMVYEFVESTTSLVSSHRIGPAPACSPTL